MQQKYCLTAAEAQKIVVACKALAQQKGWAVSIAVVDEGGYLIHVERLDAASLQTPEVAISKARTAALSRRPTKALEDVVKERPSTALFPGRLPVQGGIPIFFREQCVGGIGVSGVQSHEDEEVAKAGLEAMAPENTV